MSHPIDQVLHGHLRFYQLLGAHGLPLPGDARPERKSQVLQIWAGCLLIMLSAVTLLCVTSDDDFLYRADAFSYFNDAMKFGFAELAVLTIYGESLWRRAPLARFWQLYATLTAASAVTWTPPAARTLWQQLVQHRRFLVQFYGTQSLELLLLTLFSLEQEVSRHILLFWCCFQPFVFVVHLRNTQFLLHLDLVRQQLVQLHDELALLVEYSHFASGAASFAGFEEYLRRRVREKQLTYERIYEMCTSFAEAFSYSVLAVLLMIYIRITVDCYFMYYTIYNNIANIDYYLLLPAVLQIPAFIYASHSCMQLVPRIAHQLHNIATNCAALSLQVQNFSLQILHEPVRIDCMGIIILDTHLLTRIAYAVCTYMIFTVQLMPKLSGGAYN